MLKRDVQASFGWIGVVLGMMIAGAGCATTVGVDRGIYVPGDAARTCANQCNEVGLALNAVVIMANNVGCVCSSAQPGPPGSNAGATAGGMAALLMQQKNQSTPVRR